MRDFLTVSSRLIALAFGAAFVLTSAVVLLLWNADHQVFNPQAFKRALLEQKVYERLPSLVAEQLTVSLSRQPAGTNSGIPVFFYNLEQQDWEIILSGLMTPQWQQAQVEGVIDQVFASLDSDQAGLSIKVSLVELKIRFQGEPGMRAFLQMLHAQPACTQEQLAEIAQAALLGSPENIPLCNPPTDLVSQFRPEIQQGLNQVAAMIPDEIDLGAQLQGAVAGGAPANDLRPDIRRARLLIRFSPLIPSALLLLVTLFGVRSLRGWLLWWGLLLLLAGLAALALGILAGPAIYYYIVNTLAAGGEAGTGMVPGLIQVGAGIAQALAAAVVRSTLLQAALITLIGFGMVVVGLLIRPRRYSGY